MRNGPFITGERVQARTGALRTGIIVSFDRDCAGGRAALVRWSTGYEQLCLTADLQRPGRRRRGAAPKACAYCGAETCARLRRGVCPRCASQGIEA